METKANYVLIGAVTLMGIIGGLAFFLWYAQLSIDRRYDYYDILFTQVSGLSRAADVQFNGISVGQVTALSISPEDGARVRVRIEVEDGAPIRANTVAQLQAQGVTGISFVSLSGAAADAPPIAPDPETGIPVIPSRPSTLNTLLESAPELLREARDLLAGLSAFTGVENQQRVATILDNVASASGGLQDAINDVRAISGQVREGVDQIAAFTSRLDGISQQLGGTLAAANTALAALTGALSSGTRTLDSARLAFDEAGALISTRGPALLDGSAAAAESLRATSDALRAEAADLAVRLDAVADLAADRLRDIEAPIAAAGPAIAAVGSVAGGVEEILRGDGKALVAEARAALASVNRILETDAAPLISDLRAAAAAVNRVASEVETDAARVGDKVETALDAASGTFRAATARLQQIAPAIAVAERALASADAAFGSADRMLNTDIEPVVTDLRATIARFDQALAGVAADLPGITTDVRTAAASASRAAGRLDSAVAASAGPVETFAAQGLPQFARVAAEARALISALEQLTRRVERDPARFFLGGQAPEYRR